MLPLLVEMMQYKDEEEQLVAAKTVWTLSFDPTVKQRLVEDEGCLQALETLAISENRGVKKMAQGALWKIKEDENKKVADAVGEYLDDYHVGARCVTGLLDGESVQ